MDELLMERWQLASARVREIQNEDRVPASFRDFFHRTAGFLCDTIRILEGGSSPSSLEEWRAENHKLYADILPENYAGSYGNPAYCEKKLGEYGKAFCFLYAELRGCIVYACEKRFWDMTVSLELFLEIYSVFSEEELPDSSVIRQILRSHIEDYCEDMMEYRIREMVDPTLTFISAIVKDADLTDLSYLYRYGEYITENEEQLALFLNALPEESIEKLAHAFTEGYRQGFVLTGKNLGKKKTVNIRYSAGTERLIRKAVLQFEEMGLSPVIYRHAPHVLNRRSQARNGFTGAVANPQYDYDHRQDSALFLSADFSARKLRAMRNAFEKYKKEAAVHAGPAVLETFGEVPFSPEHCAEALSLNDAQQKLQSSQDNAAAQIQNRYIPGEERSFTIMALPVPQIGPHFEDIFRETVKINTLDNDVYREIQKKIIDCLDSAPWVEVKGRDDNETDLLIHLHDLKNKEKQTNFENCVADVNIPLGEVFTSPVLAGTGGVLHVKKVFLSGLEFKDLRLVIDCGQVIDYSCGNFEDAEKGRRYIEDNILYHHPKIPMGEFAIGTNTTAYSMAKRYGIFDRLPILIAEKTGPHFAFGDTCYSFEEDVAVYNPDGKEVIARENEISALRKEDPELAYYGCHTDVTIPFDELGSIRVIDEDGEMVSILEDGRFVLPGTELLNAALDELQTGAC